MRHEYLTLEHLLWAICREPRGREVLRACGANVDRLLKALVEFLEGSVERLPDGVEAEPQQTIGIERVLQRAAIHALSAEQKIIEIGDVLVSLFREEESQALYLLKQEGVRRIDLLNYISHGVTKESDGSDPEPEQEGGHASLGDDDDEPAPTKNPLEAYTTNLLHEAELGHIDPLIGRELEL